MMVPTYESTAREQEIIIKNQRKQIQELTNNWNELEEWINRNCFYDDDTLTYEELINKMEEIKEGHND